MKSCPLGSFSSARLTARGTFAEHYRAGELSGSCAMLLPDGRAGQIAFDHLDWRMFALRQGAISSLRGCRGLTASPFQLIVSYMVNYNERLDRTFAALVDPTRRAILARLEREDSASISALAQPFVIKLPAVMKHLDVLDDAGLITRSKVGRTVTVRLRPEPMREAIDWLRRYERFWSKSLDRLAAYVENKETEARKKRR